MTRRMMTGNAAAAWGARLAEADYLPAFPITPQTEIVETLAGWCARGEIDARLVMLESEHSMLTAAAAAAATGVRVFTATSIPRHRPRYTCSGGPGVAATEGSSLGPDLGGVEGGAVPGAAAGCCGPWAPAGGG